MIKDEASYLSFFEAIETIEVVLSRASELTVEIDRVKDIEGMRAQIDIVVDQTVSLAAIFGWKSALRWGGFNQMFEEFNLLANRFLDPQG